MLELAKQKAALIEQRDEIVERLARTHKHLFEKEKPVSADFAEQQIERANDDVVMNLDAGGREELARIDRALARIEGGDYEICANCHQPIGSARLEVIPYADLCVTCAQEAGD